jgi:hypothetical protein
MVISVMISRRTSSQHTLLRPVVHVQAYPAPTIVILIGYKYCYANINKCIAKTNKFPIFIGGGT